MKKRYNLLRFTFWIMAIIGAVLTAMYDDRISVIINILVFVIAGIIFNKSKKLFKKIYNTEQALVNATKKIDADYKNEQEYLWGSYKDKEDTYLFEDCILFVEYKKYIAEMKRLETVSSGTYKCDISDYINKELLDITVKKNLLNLVPGTMTGMGILGTFVGLSIALQNFNTGSAAEISDSIAPLMNGIKVAFHTSIFGMVFSLVFNYVYKMVMEEAYSYLDDFIYAYDHYVTGNTDNDNESKLKVLIQDIPAQIGSQLGNILKPQFDKLTTSLEAFAMTVNEKQLEGVGALVEEFNKGLSEALGENFLRLGKILEETCELQEKNNKTTFDVLEKINSISQNIVDINKLTEKTIESMSGYISEIETLQDIINQNFMSVNIQLEEHSKAEEAMKGYIETLVNHEKQITSTSKQFTADMAKQIEILNILEKEIAENSKTTIDMLANATETYGEELSKIVKEQMKEISNVAITHNDQIAEAAKKQINEVISIASSTTGDMDRAAHELGEVTKQLNNNLAVSLNNTFDIFDKNLADISTHLSGTISEVRDTTDRVPETVRAAYEGMEKSFTEMRKNLDGMVHTMDIMQRNMRRLTDRIEQEI